MIDYKEGMPITAPCYITDMPAEVYHAHPESISNSGLRLVSRSPAHYRYAPKLESTRAMVIGSALHMAVLEPDLFLGKYVDSKCEDRRSKYYKDLAERYGGEYVLTIEETKHVVGIRDSLWSKFGELLSLPGHTELSGFSTDPETGVMCRHRFDKLTNCGIAIDLKTSVDARPEAFSRSIYNYGYHMQNAFYADQYEWITGEQITDFIFLVVESEAPYACKMYRLNQESIEVGRYMYRQALNEYASCKGTGVWPAYYGDEIEEIGIPHWAINQHEQKQIESFVFMED